MPYDSLIKDPVHKPKVLAKTYVTALKAAKAKATIVKAEATMPRGWDYGVLIELNVTPKNSADSETLVLTLNVGSADDRNGSSAQASGIASVGKGLGQVISTQRSGSPDQVIKRLASDSAAYFGRQTESSQFEDMIRLLESS